MERVELKTSILMDDFVSVKGQDEYFDARNGLRLQRIHHETTSAGI